MAKHLSALKLRNDHNGRQVRCLIQEEQGHLVKIKERSTIQETLNDSSFDGIVVYEPTQSERQQLFETLRKSTVLENGELIASLEETDLFLLLMNYTTVELPNDLDEKRQLMEEVLAEPSPLFLLLKNELDILVIELMSAFHELTKSYQQLPDDLLEASNRLVALESGLKEKEQEKRAKLAEIERLKAEIEAMEQENLSSVH